MMNQVKKKKILIMKVISQKAIIEIYLQITIINIIIYIELEIIILIKLKI